MAFNNAIITLCHDFISGMLCFCMFLVSLSPLCVFSIFFGTLPPSRGVPVPVLQHMANRGGSQAPPRAGPSRGRHTFTGKLPAAPARGSHFRWLAMRGWLTLGARWVSWPDPGGSPGSKLGGGHGGKFFVKCFWTTRFFWCPPQGLLGWMGGVLKRSLVFSIPPPPPPLCGSVHYPPRSEPES